MSEPFPWAKVMRFAFGHLRLAPDDFWAMSVHELNAAMSAHLGASELPMSRSNFNQLLQQFPDG